MSPTKYLTGLTAIVPAPAAARLSLWLLNAETEEVTSNRETTEWVMDASEADIVSSAQPTAANLSLTVAGEKDGTIRCW